jgi:hypothetical protein
MNRIAIPALTATCIFLSACIFGGGGGDPAGTNPPGYSQSMKYRIDAGELFVSDTGNFDYGCTGDSLWSHRFPPTEDTMAFTITGRDLSLARISRPIASGAVVLDRNKLTRVGTGSGLNGTWKYLNMSYEISGAPTEKEKADLANAERFLNQYTGYILIHYRFGDGILTVFQDAHEAEQFIDAWNGDYIEWDGTATSDSGKYAIALSQVDQHTVALKGLKSGETVTLALSNRDGKTFASDVPSHPRKFIPKHPANCPLETEPQWYRDFLAANAKTPAPPAAKAAGLLQIPNPPPSIHIFPLSARP